MCIRDSQKELDQYAEKLFACSNMAGWFMFGENANFEVIHNAIDAERFCFSQEKRNQIRTQLKISPDTRLYGTVGRLEEQKNPGFILDVFRCLHEKDPECRFIHVGDGSLRGEIEKKIGEMCIRDRYKNCVNAGIFVFEKKICDYVPEPVKRNLENDVIKGMLEAGEPIYGYCSPEYVKDVGTVDRVNQTLADIERGVIAGKCLRNKQRCIFMDRDGTINQYKGLVYKEEDFTLEGLSLIHI